MLFQYYVRTTTQITPFIRGLLPLDLTFYNILGQNKRLERADEVVAIPQVKVMMLSSSA